MLGAQVFDAGGQRWTLFLGNAAQCAVEEQYGKGFFAVVADAVPDVDAETALAIASAMSGDAMPSLSVATMEKMASAMRRVRLSVLRDLAWHGLQRHHPGVTLDEVSDVADQLGQHRFGEVIGNAIRAAQGRGEGQKEDDRPVAPGKPSTRRRAPTGKGSSRNGPAPGSTSPPSG
ncbi:hypothetical protein GCM10022253_24040 [Sphingomonas endophytica]|uniref:ANTAR domain-containing protein n=1 Tax=Sphingomonas endophytica TaxID=869719 RepID=A0ABR6N5F5_9SPHN|nr:hypothetical protein [Sphingomonas endophytica]MBB5725052.1 hypothetical protein [Sphingomonas endophytica]